jgi:hypothetical protein
MSDRLLEPVPLSHALGKGTLGQPPQARPSLRALAARVLEGVRETVPPSHAVGIGTVGQAATSPVTPKSERVAEWDTEDWHAFYDERASIGEYDGELDRPAAERQAFEATIIHWMNLNPLSSLDDDQCAQCGSPVGRVGNDAVPFLVGGGGHVWLHHGCHAAWMACRRREATEAISAMGIACTTDN